MTEKIAVINDLSGFGKCSLTAAISAIAAMGVQPCPLPTAVLSAQTGYPSYYYDDYTDRMESVFREWEKMGVRFDGIYTGFVSGGHQIEKVLRFLDVFCGEDTFLLVDPVMGDNGARYPVFTGEMEHQMRRLASRADIITPNLTELCLLTGTDCRMVREMHEEGHLREAAEEMASGLLTDRTKEIVVTGIRYREKETGTEMMGNLALTKEGASFSAFPFIGDSYSGTGDLFASVIAGGRARGDSLADSMKLAGEMIERAIADAVRDGVPRNDGVEYERYLWMLGEANRLKDGAGSDGSVGENKSVGDGGSIGDNGNAGDGGKKGAM